jgi:hypothetical protein
MSDAALKRIQKQLEKLLDQQTEICQRIEALETQAVAAAAPTRAEVVQILDGFRVGETLGEVSIGAWLEVCRTDCVRGALRTIQQREGMHARLLGARLCELGAELSEIPDEAREQAIKQLGSTKKTDAEKISDFAEQFPDPEALLKPLSDLADRLDADQETQWLLRAILQDERSTLNLIHEADRMLNG